MELIVEVWHLHVVFHHDYTSQVDDDAGLPTLFVHLSSFHVTSLRS